MRLGWIDGGTLHCGSGVVWGSFASDCSGGGDCVHMNPSFSQDRGLVKVHFSRGDSRTSTGQVPACVTSRQSTGQTQSQQVRKFTLPVEGGVGVKSVEYH